jgi:RNA polymerase sigma factor (TIGR02999 family)
MKTTPPETLTQLLQAWSSGDSAARDQLFSFVYAELRRRADRYLRRENSGHTLQPTDLVHEAYLRLSAQNPGWKNRVQFFAVASQMMRRILVDHARARRAAKRPDRTIQVTFGEAPGRDPREVDIIALEEALEELAKADARTAQLVDLRFFGGLTQEEAASVLGISLATANRDWRVARAWLRQRGAGGS